MKTVYLWQVGVIAMAAACAQPAMAQSAPAAATCTLPEPPPPPGADAPALSRASFALAQLYYPEDMIMAVVERTARDAFEQGVRAQPGGEAIIREHPGLVDVGFAATMRVLRRCSSRLVLGMQGPAAELFSRELSPAHIVAISDFYRSETGRATMAAVVRTMRPPEVRVRADGTPEPVTSADVRASIGTNFMQYLTPQHIRELAAFAQSPHGQAFMRIAPQLEQLTIGGMNGTNSALTPEIQAEVGTAVDAYLAGRTGRRQR